MTTPDYYTTTPGADLYDLWRERYGLAIASRHLELTAMEYLYRAPSKRQYTADLVKVQAIVARLRAWHAEERRDADATPRPPPSLPHMTASEPDGSLTLERVALATWEQQHDYDPVFTPAYLQACWQALAASPCAWMSPQLLYADHREELHRAGLGYWFGEGATLV